MAVPPMVPAPVPASLYVGDLQPDVSDAQLFEAFSTFGTLTSVRVCRDSISGRSLGYGYVNFIAPHEAKLAIEKLNHTPLNGKPIRIMWSHRDPDARKSGIGNLFVKLHEMFAKFGNILSCKVVLAQDGKSKGYGFVQFESEESANAATDSINATFVGGKQIYVGDFIKRSDRILPSPDAKYTNLYIKNIDLDITEEHLREKFSEFGKITNLAIAKDESGSSKGFGFINFDSTDEAKRAMESTNGVQLGSKVLYIARAQKKSEREQILCRLFEERRNEKMLKYKGSNVYVKNINDDVNDDHLREHFSQCGMITSAKLMRDTKGISKGFGFVCFCTPDEANKAVATLHGYMFHGKPLYVAIAQKREDRCAQLQLQYAQRMAALAGSSATVIPAGYPPLYYSSPPRVVSQIPPRQGLMYQPLGLRPGWPSGYAPPTRPAFQPMPMPAIPNARQHRQNRGRMNGHMVPTVGQTVTFMPHIQQTAQLINSLKDGYQQRAGKTKYVPNGRHNINNGSAVPSAASNSLGAASQGLEMLSSMLAAASPQQQKPILGEHLFPLVKKHKLKLAAKITGMLLEMDNSELLLLLETPESLATKVEKAVQVLKLSKAEVGSQDTLHSTD